MSADTYIKTSGAWKKCKNIYVKNSGIWRECKKVYSKVSGTWREVFRVPEYTKDIFEDGSCLGLWRFDSSLAGEDGSPNASMYNGNVVWGAGKSGQAFVFSDQNVIEIENIEYRDVKAWSFWVRSSTDLCIYISPNNTNAYTYIKCYFNSDTLFIEFWAKHYASSLALQIIKGKVENVITNYWYHIVVQWHYNYSVHTTYATVYINGNHNKDSYKSSTEYPHSGNVLIGKYNTYYSNGYIDHLRVFNRELSAAEVQTLYHELD